MVGPVLYQELLLGGRRNSGHWLRWVYGGWLVLQALVLLIAYSGQRESIRALGEFARYYILLFIVQHFIILTLITPVVAASAISDEKWRGTLQHLLTTDLLAWEIVTGKLFARTYQSLLLVLMGLPLVAFIGTLAGLSLVWLLAVCAATVLVGFGLAGAGLLASVWCRHTRDAVLGLYLVGAVLYGSLQGTLFALAPGSPPSWLDSLLFAADPIQPLGRDWMALSAGELGRRLLACLAFWGTLGATCLALATLLLRWTYVRQMEATGRQKKPRWWSVKRPAIPREPLRWKERYVEGLAPLGMLRALPTWLGVTLVVLLTVWSAGTILLLHLPFNTSPSAFLGMIVEGDLQGVASTLGGVSGCETAFFAQGWVLLLMATLIVGIRCSGAITGEREKQTWESLLLTPLETRQILRGKLWGIIGASYPYLLAYAIPALLLSALAGVWNFFWVLLWLGVTLVGLYYVGAAGLWCSAKAKTSWRSLLWTLGLAYLGSFVLYCVTAVGGAILAFAILLCVAILDQLLRTAGYRTSFTLGLGEWANAAAIGFCLALAAGFVIAAYRFLVAAETHINTQERTRNWQDYSFRPRRRSLPRGG